MRAYIVGVGCSAFGQQPHVSFRDLARDVATNAVDDAGLLDGKSIHHIAFGNCAMGEWGQTNIRGQVALTPLLNEQFFSEHTPIVNLEGGCATGSMAFQSAYQSVVSGGGDLAMAIGVEKTWIPNDKARSFRLFSGGIDQLHRDEWLTFFRNEAQKNALRFEPDARRVIFLDIHALMAQDHMARFGTRREHFALVARKNRAHASQNPKAQFKNEMTVEEILNDSTVVEPLTRSMCCPISDGAAAVLIANERWLKAQPQETQSRAILIRSAAVAGGRYRALSDTTVVEVAAQRAYQKAGVGAQDIQIAEVHDATAFCEISHYESLGFCAKGEGPAYLTDGHPYMSGSRPTNLSGGLIGKGHPLGATGLGMFAELSLHMRGEGVMEHSAKTYSMGLVQNCGGMIGPDEALCAVTILERI